MKTYKKFKKELAGTLIPALQEIYTKGFDDGARAVIKQLKKKIGIKVEITRNKIKEVANVKTHGREK